MSDKPDSVTTGAPAPEFSLPASNGTEVKLADFRSKANVVLFFVREFE